MRRVTIWVLVLLASPLRAQDLTGTDALIAAITEAGCVVTAMNEATVLAASGLTEHVAAEIVKMMMTDGRAVPQGDDLRLVTGDCQ